MKAKKKIEMRKTPLDRLAAQIRTVLRRRTRDVIVIGNFLIEARKHLEHGEWQSWLVGNFDLSYSTVINYMNAAEYVARKTPTVADFNALSPRVLYWLAAGEYSEEEEAAILAATHTGRIDETRAGEICEALEPPSDDAAECDAGTDDDDEPEDEPEDPEITAILDGPPPDLPPPEPIAPPDVELAHFDRIVTELLRHVTKPLAHTDGSKHTASDLRAVGQYLIDAGEHKLARARDRAPQGAVLLKLITKEDT